MATDATEAALGLLGLTGSIRFPPVPSTTTTSTSTSTSTSTTLPASLKRKPSSPSLPLPLPSTSSSSDADAIRCICNFTYDDGFSIACDDCSRWVHAACFDITDSAHVPEEWRCWVCQPRKVDRERAVRIQRAKQAQGFGLASGSGTGGIASSREKTGDGVRRRVSSPGVDRKRRFAGIDSPSSSSSLSTSAAKRKRRYSTTTTTTTTQHAQTQTQGEDEHIEIDSPLPPISPSIPSLPLPLPTTDPTTHARLRALARRGLTALSSLPSPLPSHDQGILTPFDTPTMRPSDLRTTPVIMSPTALAAPPPTFLRPLSPRSSEPLPLPLPRTSTSVSVHSHSSGLGYAHSHSSGSGSGYAHPPSTTIQNATLSPIPTLGHAQATTGTTKTNPAELRPPTYALHTAAPIKAKAYIAPLVGVGGGGASGGGSRAITITPTSNYLADPLNTYALLGCPRPGVWFVGEPWGVALDSRVGGGGGGGGFAANVGVMHDGVGVGGMGGSGVGGVGEGGEGEGGEAGGRYARSGCWPNAVLRPVICSRLDSARRLDTRPLTPTTNTRLDTPTDTTNTNTAQDRQRPPIDTPPLTFALFATRDLKAHEEVVLGWEWDDGCVVHVLPALIAAEGVGAAEGTGAEMAAVEGRGWEGNEGRDGEGEASGDGRREVDGQRRRRRRRDFGPDPEHTLLLKQQLSTMLHALSSVFATCACGARSETCVLNRLAEFVNSSDERGDERGEVDLGPLVGSGKDKQPQNGLRTREKVPWSGGVGGVEIVPSQPSSASVRDGEEWYSGFEREIESEVEIRSRKGKGKGRELDLGLSEDVMRRTRKRKPEREKEGEREEQLPPKLRKRWIGSRAERLREENARENAREGEREREKPPDSAELGRGRERDKERMDVDGDGEREGTSTHRPASPSISPHLARPPSPIVHSPTSPTSPALPSTSPHIPSFASLSLLSPLVPASGSSSGPHFPGSFRQASAERAVVAGYFTPREREERGEEVEARGTETENGDGRGRESEQVEEKVEERRVKTDERSPHVSFAKLPEVEAAMEVDGDGVGDKEGDKVVVEVDADVEMADEKHGEEETTHAPPVEETTHALPVEEKMRSSPHEETRATPPHEETRATPPHEDTTEIAPREEKQPSPPPSPPQPKPKKMSLRDFALRKKRLREEEQRAHADSQSPQVESPRPDVDEHEERGTEEPHEHANGVEMAEERHTAVSEEVTTPPGLAVPTEAEHAKETTPPPETTTLEAKVELVEAVVPQPTPHPPEHAISPLSPSPPPISPPPPPISPIPPPSSRNKKENEPAAPVSVPVPVPVPARTLALTRQLSHEDGEILSPRITTAKTLPLAPRAHSPPTHPRSFHAHASPPSRPPRRPLQPAAYRPQLQNIPAPPPTVNTALGSRPLPSGPRALRGVNGYASGANTRPLGLGPGPGLGSGMHHAPRAPSADRDRDRDRVEWERDRPRPGGWGARGRGSWR